MQLKSNRRRKFIINLGLGAVAISAGSLKSFAFPVHWLTWRKGKDKIKSLYNQVQKLLA